MNLYVEQVNRTASRIYLLIIIFCLTLGQDILDGTETWINSDSFVYYLLPKGNESYDENSPPPYVHHVDDAEIKDTKQDNATAKFNPWVKLVMQPLFVAEMKMKQMEFSTDFNLFVTWEDGRLQRPKGHLRNTITEVIHIRDRVKDTFNPLKVWLPKIQFANCKGIEEPLRDFNRMTGMTLRPRIQRITANYTFSLQFFCEYTFTRYPFDKQQCSIQVNYVHGVPIVNLITTVFVKDKSKFRVPPEFHIKAITTSNCPNQYTAESKLVECFDYVFTFQRIYDQHIMLLFIPSMLIVSLSWISFWLDESAAPPRVALGLTSLLTLATQFNNAQKDLPAVADIKAIDIWMLACMIMVFTSLVEFAISNYFYRRKLKSAPEGNLPEAQYPERKRQKLPEPKYVYSVPRKFKLSTAGVFEYYPSIKTRSQPDVKKCCSWAHGNLIDVFSRIIFPLAFFIFNITFWVYFTT